MFKRTRMSALLLVVLLSKICLWAGQKPTEPTENCSTKECHNAYRKKQYVHEPVARGVCKLCHKLIDAKKHSFKLVRTRQELCGSCHQEQLKGKYLHEPIGKGKCLDCHNPHNSDYKFLIPVAAIAELCLKCHDKKEIANKLHEPVAEGKCTLCHKNHGSEYRPLLVKNQRQLCFSCHEDTMSELDRFKYAHKPVVDRGCTVCHAAHRSDYFRLLIKEYPSEFYASFDISKYDLCFSCHKADKVLIKETENLTDFRNGKTNLHYLHVNTSEKGRTCRACHATHASDEPKHLRKAVAYGGWGVPIQFKKTESGGGCSPGCHDPRNYDRSNPVIYKSDKKF
jgi:predicted CXXCH cytochrome family protein